MCSYEASILIAAPRESVWCVLSDVAVWPEWLPTVSSVQPVDGTALAVGSRYNLRQPKLPPATWEVTEVESPRRFVWRARSPGLLMVAEHTVDEAQPGRSRVVLRFAFSGLLGVPVGKLFRSVTERYLSQEVTSLKLTVEKLQQRG
ncbi:hypothetical protein LPB72_14090 [Hydrogenophaga crassostreae]|uniref:Polyketide cyclase n=1 Tax=Hydrogenophaga crassostreae TaxID=1763535 RepID=A0A167HED1_9BURK|nr:SRPBCC family protein [Hydrogenophaga crassostreae]AOW12114.1 hypothetical protein LPB072_03850 [Hydrogenophaga crassostreae]OAD41058.1 hypothetical protein LPB72_14090 [Hydrogenophaga crassostreae]